MSLDLDSIRLIKNVGVFSKKITFSIIGIKVILIINRAPPKIIFLSLVLR